MPTLRPPKRGVSYSTALAEAYASAPDDEVILETLEFTHSSFSTPNRIVNDHDDLDAKLESGMLVTFKHCYFNIQRGSESDSGRSPELAITISNVSQLIVPDIEKANTTTEPVMVTYRPYLASDLEGPHMSPPLQLAVKSITSDTMTVTIRAGFRSLSNKKFPSIEYTAKNFNGLTAR